MNSSSLSAWLKSYDLEQFLKIFEENEVDLVTLRVLTENDLKELGLPFGPRKRILNLLNEEKALEKLAATGARTGSGIGERRQLTVLFCDMVGFTKLAYKLDPEKLQIIIRAYEEACAECVNRYEGYVFTTLGDGVVAFFGATKRRLTAPSAPGWKSSRQWRDCMSRVPVGYRFASASPQAWWL